MSRELTPQETAERSLIKKYRKELWNPFIAAVKRYELIVPGDDQLIPLDGSNKGVPQLLPVFFDETALRSLLWRQFTGHSAS